MNSHLESSREGPSVILSRVEDGEIFVYIIRHIWGVRGGHTFWFPNLKRVENLNGIGIKFPNPHPSSPFWPYKFPTPRQQEGLGRLALCRTVFQSWSVEGRGWENLSLHDQAHRGKLWGERTFRFPNLRWVRSQQGRKTLQNKNRCITRFFALPIFALQNQNPGPLANLRKAN